MSTRFFILADTHVGSSKVSLADFQQSLSNCQQIAPDAGFIHLGDFTNYSEDELLRQELAVIGGAGFKAVALTLGNHDVRGEKGGEATTVDCAGWLDHWKKIWQPTDCLTDPRFTPYHEAIATFTNFKQTIGLAPVLYDEQVVAGFHLLSLCTERPLKDACYLSEAQLLWLDLRLQEIRKETTRPIFILSHQALNDTHRGANEYGGFGDQDQAVKAILAKYQDIFFLSGHIHNGLGTADNLLTAYGCLVDVPSFCLPDVGAQLLSVGYLMTIAETKITFTPYRLGTVTQPDWEELSQYQKEILL